MLLHLHIRNVAIIEESAMDFGEGFHVFTGETGAGKSILIDALLLALGERSNADLLRTGAKEAEISALFSISHLPHIKQHFETAGIAVEEGELLLRRLIMANGRSRAYINDRPVTAKFLRESGQQLVEISGQHEHQHLMHPRYHLDLVDSYGNLWPERQLLLDQYNQVQRIRKQLHKLGGDAYKRQKRREYLKYQIAELEDVDLDVNEDDLQQQRRYLQQLEKMVEGSNNAEQILYSGGNSMLEQLGRLQQRLQGWEELSEEIAEALRGMMEAEASLDDAARTLRNFTSSTKTEPYALKNLEEQLTQLRDLKRKHGASSVMGLVECLDEYQRELLDLDQREVRMQELETSFDREIETLCGMAEGLSVKRKSAAIRLAEEIEEELASLDMKKAKFVVDWDQLMREDQEEQDDFAEEDWSSNESMLFAEEDELWPEATENEEEARKIPGPAGYDLAQFLLSSNPGEEPKPLHRIASGGELSRIMLALKQVVKEKEPVPTSVFDEIDAGIGGATAVTIGHKIRGIASQRQVLCNTHLAQIASLADQHYLIKKQEEDGRTHSRIHQLDHQQREREIARMLDGKATDQSLAHARELLIQTQKNIKQTASKPNKKTKKQTKKKSSSTRKRNSRPKRSHSGKRSTPKAQAC